MVLYNEKTAAGQIVLVRHSLCSSEIEEENELAKNEDVELLMTVPDIGISAATTIAAYAEELDRIEGNYQKFAAYVGIVPGCAQIK